MLIRVAGFLWIVALVFRTPDDTFFVGDSGLKAIQAQQFSEGRTGLALDMGEPAFARALYADEFFPFAEPFAYRIDGAYFSTFPVAFQVLTAPFVALLGFRGLYAWPLIGLWLCWAATDRFSIACGLGMAARGVTLFLLVFCSPLSVYGGLFWEHTLAVALVMIGCVALSDARQSWRGFAGGLALSSAVWLREETLLLTLLSAVVVILGAAREPDGRRGKGLTLLGLGLPVAFWLLFNEAAYGTPIGLRALQHGPGSVPPWNLPLAAARLQTLAALFVVHFPPALLMLPSLVLTTVGRRSLPATLRAPLLIGATFLCFLPLGAPNEGGNQWGPRYLLVLLPVTAVAIGWLAQQALAERRAVGASAVAILGIAALPALRLNSWEGPETILANARSRAEAVGPVRADPRSIVVVSQQFASQQLARAFQEKTFFLTSKGRSLKRLAERLVDGGHREFLYLCDPEYPCPSALEGLPPRAIVAAGYGDSVLTLTRLGDWGRYVAYAGKCTSVP